MNVLVKRPGGNVPSFDQDQDMERFMVVCLVTHVRTPGCEVCDHQVSLGADLRCELRIWSAWVRVDTGINDAGG